MYISIAKDFSETCGHRKGMFSGELFRDTMLIPKYLECLNKKENLIIDFDGGYGYPHGFLEEAFGGFIRKGYSAASFFDNVILISKEDESVILDIIEYMSDALDIRNEEIIKKRERKKK